MEWIERISRVVRAQITYLVQEAEDPEKILSEAIALMEEQLIAMRRALAEAIATHLSSQRQLMLFEASAQKWYERAQLAIDKGNEKLAREALVNRQSYQVQAQSLQQQLEGQNQSIGKVKQNLRQLEQKFTQARAKKSLYLARLRSAAASQKLHEIVGNLNSESASGVFERIEAKILELEAQSELTIGQISDPLEQQFATLEGSDSIESQLAQLKANKKEGS